MLKPILKNVFETPILHHYPICHRVQYGNGKGQNSEVSEFVTHKNKILSNAKLLSIKNKFYIAQTNKFKINTNYRKDFIFLDYGNSITCI